MYIGTIINELVQFNTRNCTLVLTDDENILPVVRIEKSYPEDITAENLALDIETTIAGVLAQQAAEARELTEQAINAEVQELLVNGVNQILEIYRKHGVI